MSTMNTENEHGINSHPSSDQQGLVSVENVMNPYLQPVSADDSKIKNPNEDSKDDMTTPCPIGETDHKMPYSSQCPESDSKAEQGLEVERLSDQLGNDLIQLSNDLKAAYQLEDQPSNPKDSSLIEAQTDKNLIQDISVGDSHEDKQEDGKIEDAHQVEDVGSVLEASCAVDKAEEKVDTQQPNDHLIRDQTLIPTELLDNGAAASASQPKIFQPTEQSLYKIKMIKWKDTNVPIVTQNENGPCPLIAIINVLLQRAKNNPFGNKNEIKAEDLLSYLGECMLLNAPKNISESAQLNYEQNMQDAFSVFPKLQTGLDVNVKFTGVRDFEYTTECIIFDLLNIPLYHGWLVDPQATDVVNAVSKLSYNQLVEKIITNKCGSESDLVTEALIAESFLERTASQLTYHGLYELNSVMKPDELAVLFRNNHFITIYKHKDELFQLVTDQGFIHENNVVWETLSNIEGDGLFVDCHFVTVPPKPLPAGSITPNTNLDEAEQIQQDFLVALSLQEEQKREEEKAMVWQQYKEKELGATEDITDEELARRIQAEEQKHAEQLDAEQQRSGSPGSSCSPAGRNPSLENSGRRPTASQRKKERDCSIL